MIDSFADATALELQRRRGFNASRNQSPNRLMLSAISTSIDPGKITSHQAPLKSCLLPSLMKVPSDGEVGETPTPRKDRVASARMAVATWMVESTSTGPITFGSTCFLMMRNGATPMTRAACTYSLLRSTIVEPRTARVLHPAGKRDGDDEHTEGERIVRTRKERAADARDQQRDQDRWKREHHV